MNLASVVVATYNSSEFVLETLESIKKQTYSPIELIVSDDGSQDNTVELARTWLVHNESRFVRTEVVTVPKNTGVSANCNRCIQASCAEWIKLIAGDDILLPNCIADNMNFVEQHPETKILFSFVRLYKNKFTEQNFLRLIPSQFPTNIMAPNFSVDHQHKLLLLSDRISFTPSYFFNKETVLAVGGYEESNKMAEDYPMWLKLTKAGIRLNFMEKETVGYRQHDKALNNIEKNVLFKPLLLKTFSFRKQTVFPHLPWDIKGSEIWTMMIRKLFVQLNWNKQLPALIFLYRFAIVYANPFQYIISFRKKILKAGNTDVFYAN
jgi:glycosyltransferase involved in cell wall biosynthesis